MTLITAKEALRRLGYLSGEDDGGRSFQNVGAKAAMNTTRIGTT